MTMRGRPQPGFGWSARFVNAAEIIAGLGYKETDDLDCWVPIAELYGRYKEIWTDRPRGHASPTLLARTEFGELLGHVMQGERVMRRVEGENTRGFAGITGPGEFHSRKSPAARMSIEDLLKMSDRMTDNKGKT